jgi:hypothetical protein
LECIVVIIGICLCLIELRYLSGRNGVRPTGCGSRFFTAKLPVVVHYCRINCSITCWRMTPSCWLVIPATVFAIALMTSSASSVSTLPEPACPIPQSWSQEPVHVGGGGRNYSRADETVARSAPGAHAAARSCFSVSAANTFTSVHRFKGSIAQASFTGETKKPARRFRQ